MTLTLSILRCPESVAPETREVAGGEFTIGRGADSDWVLADPDRFLSKRHCALAFRAGEWQLADLSTNGTFLNREAGPLGRGATRALRDGDRLKLGPYEIEVRISEDAASAPDAAPFAAPSSARDLLDPFGDDPFAPAGPSAFAAPPATSRTAPPAVALPPDFDPLVPNPTDEPFTGPVQSDHSEAIEDAFRAPEPARELLPDDWDLDLTPAAPTTPSVAPPAAVAPPDFPEVPPPPPTPPEPVAPRAPAAPAPAPHAGAAGSLLAAFLDGAGVPSAEPADPEAMMRALGATFRALVTGLRQILIARQAVKGEFRIEQTMVRARGNNPLKFSAGDDDALAALLGTGRHTDMGPAEAVADALGDIRLHELASVAAMQAAVRALLARFDPAALRGVEGGLPGFGGGRKARAWDAFEKLHAEVTAALADDFDSVFGKAFARAYEKALADIAARGEPS